MNVQMSVENCNNNIEDKENTGSPVKKKIVDFDVAEILQQTKGALTDLRKLILQVFHNRKLFFNVH